MLSERYAALPTFPRCVPAKQPAPRGERAWVEIDLAALRHNLLQIEGILPQGCRVMAVVKADAYGHGAVRVALELEALGVAAFAVATRQEGIALHRSGIRGDILILGYNHPDCARQLQHYCLTQTVVDGAHAEALHRSGQRVRVHIKIDTGMHRSGEPCDRLDEITRMLRLPNLLVTGMYTHLSAADSAAPDDQDFTQRQIAAFQGVVCRLRAQGCCPGMLHVQSSYGALNYPEVQGCTLVRICIALYGALSDADDWVQREIDLRPVLSVRAVVAIVKEIAPGEAVGYARQFIAVAPTRVATITIGYADGVPRNLAGGYILIRGQRAPIIGRISMDQLNVDVTGVPDARRDDVATLVGQDGDARIPVEQVARQCGTIANEVLSRLGPRLPRIYVCGNPEGT